MPKGGRQAVSLSEIEVRPGYDQKIKYINNDKGWCIEVDLRSHTNKIKIYEALYF